MKLIVLAPLFLITLSSVTSHPHLYNPYYKLFRYNSPSSYASHYSQFLPTYADIVHDSALSAYLSTPDFLPTLNVLAEVPYAITNSFTVVPMLVVSKDNMHMVSNAQIMSISKKKPVMTIKNKKNQVIQCTPAVKIVLEKPITVYTLKTSILFPSEIEIVHAGLRLPIRVGAIIAPVKPDTYISVETPIAVNVVYAVPTRPINYDYVNHDGVIEIPDNQAVVVESEPVLPPKNVTIIDFPEKEAEPVLTIDEEDDELVNRNPPILLAPAGIVQSTQPITHIEQFTNSKESPVLIALREEALKNKRV
ncbi:uncharacterized protein LOC123013407 [Tribolium madens]|uniref:uncharacterized protein LOC123013407 n=1 Tax=Tribolium madens TaxID=41895 RepID=UPI001CF74623|nr:uncharacterized protein LOC123013407 [Tribolium madens]